MYYIMSPSDWGPPTWIFLHTLAEKVKDANVKLFSFTQPKASLPVISVKPI